MVRIEIKIENGELGKTVEMRGSSKEVLISLLALEDVTKEIKNSMKEELFVEAENNE